MNSPSRDQALAILIGGQDRLDEAYKQGPAHYEDAFEHAPRGVEEPLVGHPPWEFIVMNELALRAIGQKLSGARELKPFVRTFRHASGTAMTMLLVDRHRRDAQDRIVGLRTAFMEVGLDEPGG